jgi:hypothetical protein
MDPIEVLPSQLIFGTKRIQGWLAGIPTDSEDTLRFAEMIEKYPARECRRRIRSHDERESRIPRRPDHVWSNDARGEIR